MRRSSKAPRSLALLLVCSAAPFAVQRAAAQTQGYDITELTRTEGVASRAYAISSTGQAVGWSQSGSDNHATHWHNDITSDLHGTVHLWLENTWPYFDVGYSEVYGISDGNQMIGMALTKVTLCQPPPLVSNAIILRPAVLTDLGTPFPGDALTNLGTFGHPCSALDSAAVGISNRNHVVGWADVDARGTMRAFLVTPVGGVWYRDDDGDFINDLLINLGTLHADAAVSSATAVNDNGFVTGFSYTTGGDFHAFLVSPVDTDGDGVNDTWSLDINVDGVNDLISDLGTLGGVNSWGRDINNGTLNGGVLQVVGESDTADRATRAFLWQSGSMTDLGTFGGRFSSSAAINEQGDVVGWAEDAERDRQAFLYTNGEMINLNDRLTTKTGIRLTEARDINQSGEIVGWGVVKGSDSSTLRAFLLKPSTLPPLSEQTTDDTSGSGGSTSGGGTGSGNQVPLQPLIPTVDTTTTTDMNVDGTIDSADTTATGPCGFGTLGMIPLLLLTLCGMKAGIAVPRRTRRR